MAVLHPLPGACGRHVVRHPIAARGDRASQGRRGDGLDRPRRRARGGDRRSRRPAHQPRPGPCRTTRRAALRRRAREVQGRRRHREPPGPTRRRAAPRSAGGHRGRRGGARLRRQPLGRPAGDAVPGHLDVRRPDRDGGQPPAGPAGRPRSRHPTAADARRPARAGGREPAPRGVSRPGAARPPLLLRRGHVRVARYRPAGPCGPDRRPGRPHRLRQVDAGRACLARDGAATRHGVPGRHRRPGPGPPAPPAFGRGGHAAHGDPRGHPRGEHHALRRDPAQHGRGGGGGAGPGRLGRRSARRPRHPAGSRRHVALGRRGAARRLRPPAGP